MSSDMSLLDLARTLRARLRREALLRALALSMAGFLLTFTLLLATDRIVEVPEWGRFLLLSLAVLGFINIFWRMKLYWKKVSEPRGLTRALNIKDTATASHFCGILELLESHAGTVNDLVRKSAENAQTLFNERSSGKWLPVGRWFKWLSLFALTLFLMVGADHMVPAIFRNTMKRLLYPLTSLERYSWVVLAPLPDKLALASGESLKLDLFFARHSLWRPSRLNYHSPEHRGQMAMSALEPSQLLLDNITRPGTLILICGDSTTAIEIEIKERPKLSGLQAVITPPSYLGFPNQTVEVDRSPVQLVYGSSLHLEAQANIPLRGVRWTWMSNIFELPLQGKDILFPAIFPKVGYYQFSFEITDTEGHTGAELTSVDLQCFADTPPLLDFPPGGKRIALLQDESLSWKVSAQDDLGLQNISLKILTINPAEDPSEPRSIDLMSGSEPDPQRLKNFETEFIFSPKALALPPATYHIYLTVHDGFPHRIPQQSRTLVLELMTREQHQKFLETAYKDLLLGLDEWVLREDQQHQSSLALAQTTLHEDRDKNMKTLKNLKNNEQRQLESLEQLRQRSESLKKEALKNPSFSKSSLYSWFELSETLSSTVEKHLQPASRLFNEWENQQKEILEHQRQAIAEIKSLRERSILDLQNTTLGRLAARLRASAGALNRLHQDLHADLPETIGLKLEEFSESQLERHTDQCSRQRLLENQIFELQEECTAVYRRTLWDIYKKIVQDFGDTEFMKKVPHLSSCLEKNYCVEYLKESKICADLMLRWAQWLEEEAAQKKSGASGGGGSMTPEQLEVLIEIMRLAEGEEILRTDTKHLSQSHFEKEDRELRAQLMTGVQKQYRERLEWLIEILEPSPARNNLEQARLGMSDAEAGLMAGRYGWEVIAAETEVIERLSAAGKSSSSGSSSPETSLSSSGASAEEGSPQEGENSDQKSEGRPTPLGSSKAVAPPLSRGQTPLELVPSRYRRAIRAYHEAVESLK